MNTLQGGNSNIATTVEKYASLRHPRDNPRVKYPIVSYPTVIRLEQDVNYAVGPVSFSFSKGLWFAFKDGTYHNPLGPDVSFDIDAFEKHIKWEDVTIISNVEFTRDLLTVFFPENKCKEKYDKLLRSYINN